MKSKLVVGGQRWFTAVRLERVFLVFVYCRTGYRLYLLFAMYIHRVPGGLVWFMVFNVTFKNINSHIVSVSFIAGGNRSTQRKLPTCRKALTLSHNVVSSTPRHERGWNSQF